MLPPILAIKIDHDHYRRGQPHRPSACAVALAAKDVLRNVDVYVGPSAIRVLEVVRGRTVSHVYRPKQAAKMAAIVSGFDVGIPQDPTTLEFVKD